MLYLLPHHKSLYIVLIFRKRAIHIGLSCLSVRQNGHCLSSVSSLLAQHSSISSTIAPSIQTGARTGDRHHVAQPHPLEANALRLGAQCNEYVTFYIFCFKEFKVPLLVYRNITLWIWVRERPHKSWIMIYFWVCDTTPALTHCSRDQNDWYLHTFSNVSTIFSK